MSGSGTFYGDGRYILTINVPSDRSSLRLRPQASFVSQLIASRHNMMAQRGKRRAPVEQAVDAYETGAAISVVRMPNGYRKTILA